MKTSEVLKHAKQYLAKDLSESYNAVTQTGKEKYICIAIATAASHNKRISDKDVERCREMVESRLEGNYVLERWLQHTGCIPSLWLAVDRATKDRIQAHRHAWLDQMITEFKSKGD